MALIPLLCGMRFSSHADMVINIDAAKGVALIRDSHTGRVMAFKATADDLGTMRVGDEVKADWKTGALIDIKGIAKTAALIEPDPGEPCCNVVAVAKDKAIANGLLSGIITAAGKPYDAVAPFHGVVIAKDLKSGALHVLEMSVEAHNATGKVASAVIDDVKASDPVWMEGTFGLVRAKGRMHAFKLRGAEGKDKQPWVLEPDAKAEGRYGIIRTNWHAKTGSGYQEIKVFLPGKRDQDEYHENFKKEHSVIEGEYDISINGMFLEKVPIKAGHATRILLGALRSTAKYENQLAIQNSKDQSVAKIQGGEIIGLPLGTYHLKVGTRTVKVDVKENEVTEF